MREGDMGDVLHNTGPLVDGGGESPETAHVFGGLEADGLATSRQTPTHRDQSGRARTHNTHSQCSLRSRICFRHWTTSDNFFTSRIQYRRRVTEAACKAGSLGMPLIYRTLLKINTLKSGNDK